MIRGYPHHASVAPGGCLVLHVSTDAPRFRARFYRWGDGFAPVHLSEWHKGELAASGSAFSDWHWPAYAFEVPADWPSAVYIAQLQEWDTAARGPRLDSAAVLFVVRGTGQARMLYKIPLATYHAYNRTGGGCFEAEAPRSHSPPGGRVTLRRPGGGVGGDTWGAADHYDCSSPRRTFAHWDAPFIRWLARNRYAAEFCTDIDLHLDPGLCRRYRLLVSAGQDEYWSGPMRERVEDFVARGGNAAFFGAKVCWRRLHLVDHASAIVCPQSRAHDARDQWWSRTGARRPEDALTGVSHRHAGSWPDGPRRAGGYVVQQAHHWLFAGTGLRHGDTFGADTTPPLVGFTCDGAPLDGFDESNGRARLAQHAASCGTPGNFQALGIGLLGDDWQERPAREPFASRSAVRAATLGVHTPNGTVFSAGTSDWAQVLARGREPRVDRITRNVLDRLLRD